jgi:hypothetical protein
MMGWFAVLPAGTPAPAQVVVALLTVLVMVRLVTTVLRWMGLA